MYFSKRSLCTWNLLNLYQVNLKILKYCLATILICAACFADAQKQLVLLKKEKVLLRLNPGDELIVTRRGEKRKIHSYINNLFDTAVVLHKTIVPLHSIERVHFKRTGVVNLIGKFFVVAGVGYFVIDQFNVIVVEGEEASLNDDVTAASVVMTAVGLPMVLIRKKSQRIRGRYRLMTVTKGSPFYVEPLNKDFPEP
jgi:hypothetical protein